MAQKPLRASQLEQNEDGDVFGKFDANKKHPFKPGWLEMVVVKQEIVETLSSGSVVVDPASIRIMPYDVATFNKLEKIEGFDKNTKVTILHDPR